MLRLAHLSLKSFFAHAVNYTSLTFFSFLCDSWNLGGKLFLRGGLMTSRDTYYLNLRMPGDDDGDPADDGGGPGKTGGGSPGS